VGVDIEFGDDVGDSLLYIVERGVKLSSEVVLIIDNAFHTVEGRGVGLSVNEFLPCRVARGVGLSVDEFLACRVGLGVRLSLDDDWDEVDDEFQIFPHISPTCRIHAAVQLELHVQSIRPCLEAICKNCL
jgi:hypothetical protein